MNDKETRSGLRGVPVITADEGINLGTADSIYLDGETKRLSAIGVKGRRGGETRYVNADDITLIGNDVFMVASENAAKPMQDGSVLGKRLKTMRGMTLITDGGRRLGKLVDFDLDRTGLLREVHLSENRTLDIVPEEVKLGDDAVIVPAAYEQKIVVSPEREGLFARVRHWTQR